jgi:molecular chaperone GrpE
LLQQQSVTHFCENAMHQNKDRRQENAGHITLSLDFSVSNLDIHAITPMTRNLETVMTDETNTHGPDAKAERPGYKSASARHEEAVAEFLAKAKAEAANQPEEAIVEPEVQEPDPLDLLRTENADLRDKYLRLAADMDNLRRRTEREVKDAKTYAAAGFARDMLAVSDNLRRALDAIPAEARESGDPGFTALVEGVEMTERGMLSTLERHGVRKLEPVGEKFDPNFHQAMFEIPNADVPNNTVLQVVQAGYTIGERVLRPAMVGVAKGGPKVVSTETTETPKAE